MIDSLSYYVWVVGSVHLESAVVFPKIYRVCDAGDSTFVYLDESAFVAQYDMRE